MILANKSGLLIAVKVLRKSRTATWVECRDEPGRERRIPNNDNDRKLFVSVDEALEWAGIEL